MDATNDRDATRACADVPLAGSTAVRASFPVVSSPRSTACTATQISMLEVLCEHKPAMYNHVQLGPSAIIPTHQPPMLVPISMAERCIQAHADPEDS